MRRSLALLSALLALVPAVAPAQQFQASPPQDFAQRKGGLLPVNQGLPAAPASAWPVFLTLGGLPNSSTNPVFVQIAGGSVGGGGTTGGSTAALQQQILTALGAPAQTGDIAALIAKNEAIRALLASPLPLATGAATAAGQPALNGDGGALAHIVNFPATQPVSAAALPLPAGAASAAKQPQPGIAGTPSADVLTVQPPAGVALATSSTAGVGALTGMVSPGVNGTALSCPATARGVRFYFPSGSGLSFTVAAVQPASAPSAVMALSQSATGPNWDESLYGETVYVTAVSGSPLYRCF